MKKITKIFIVALALMMLVGTLSVFAYEPYDTYTYSIDGEQLKSPTAYRAEGVFDALAMDLSSISPENPKLSSATDIVSDENGEVYIADSGNNRIVILDKYYKAKAIISEYIDENGKRQTFNDPRGVYVTDPEIASDKTSHIYIADSGNKRIVIFDREYNYERTIAKPNSQVIDDADFVPQAIAVDLYGRIFIASKACAKGVIVLSREGNFTGFIGVQEVSLSIVQIIWRNFQSDEQKESAVKNLAVPYNNITVDDDGFVYVTTSSTDATRLEDKADFEKKQYASIKAPSAVNSPVKKLNSSGSEIMSRNGFFDPAGEVDIKMADEVSKLVDVSIGEEGSWTILDASRNRLFTYDQNGNLLFAFGGIGDQLGNGENFVAMTYQKVGDKNYLIVLDNAGAEAGYKVTVYSPTPYHEMIMKALRSTNEHRYTETIYDWQDVLTQNNNFDLAYIGIGKALYSQGKYEEAQEMLENAYETAYHDKAFSEVRKEIVQKWLLLIVIAVIVLIVLVIKFFGYAKKKNKAVTLKVGRKTYGEELIYAAYLIFHPFDAFWDLKHEKRGSVRASLTIMGVTILAFFYQAIGQGYSFNPRGDYSTVFIQIIAVVVPVMLWCVGNWCLTTLFDGEGSFKDIVIATGYALTPLPVFVIISTIMTNFMTSSEGSMVSLLVTIGYIWVGLLLFFGMLVTHGYTMGKNFLTVIGTIVAMAIIIFVIVLFSGLVTKMVTFVISIFTEIASRS